MLRIIFNCLMLWIGVRCLRQREKWSNNFIHFMNKTFKKLCWEAYQNTIFARHCSGPLVRVAWRIHCSSPHVGKIIVEAHSLHEALDLVDVVPCSFGRVPILNSRSNTGGIQLDILLGFLSDGCLGDWLRSENLFLGLLIIVFALVLHFLVARVLHDSVSVVRGIVVGHI